MMNEQNDFIVIFTDTSVNVKCHDTLSLKTEIRSYYNTSLNELYGKISDDAQKKVVDASINQHEYISRVTGAFETNLTIPTPKVGKDGKVKEYGRAFGIYLVSDSNEHIMQWEIITIEPKPVFAMG